MAQSPAPRPQPFRRILFMICKVCGTQNDDSLEYCQKCNAPLHDSPTRSFVRPPVWSKPDFNANTISESDIPADFLSGSAEATASAAPAQQEQARYNAPAAGSVCPKCGARLSEVSVSATYAAQERTAQQLHRPQRRQRRQRPQPGSADTPPLRRGSAAA